MNVPNILTIFRICLIPVFILFFDKGLYYPAMAIYALAGMTDVLDGYLARKYRIETNFGKLADPFADKLMQLTALIMLTRDGIIPVFVVIIVAAKELFMVCGAFFLLRRKDFVVKADWFGKLATFVFFVSVIGCILCSEHVKIFSEQWTGMFMIVALCATLFAFYGYLIQFKNIMMKRTDT